MQQPATHAHHFGYFQNQGGGGKNAACNLALEATAKPEMTTPGKPGVGIPWVLLRNSAGTEFFGVADGTRTHDDQNHNLWRRANNDAGCSGVDGKFSSFLTSFWRGLPDWRSQSSEHELKR
ncbi:MAG: hypothetical protein V4645_20565 [Pseudomonadota bacterium]